MRKLLFLLFALPLPAQVTVTVNPVALSVPLKTFQTFSAHVTGANDKTVTWSTTGGTLTPSSSIVCTNGTSSDCTIALYSATAAGPFTVTATANDASHATATATVTFTALDTPKTNHPRLWLTTSNLSAFQTYMASGAAIATNYTSIANSEAAADDADYNPSSGGGGYTCAVGAWPGGGTGIPNATWVDGEENGGTHFPELGAWAYALMANGDPAHTADWTCRAHDNFLYVAKSILGLIPGSTTCTSCFYVPIILLGNRGSVWAEGPGLTLDWVYSSFSPTEWTTYIIPAMTKMQTEMNNGGVVSNSQPEPVGTVNDPSLVQTSSANAYGYVRSFANNYALYMGSTETVLGLALDAAQDPSTSHCAGAYDVVCTDGVPNSVRAGFHYGLGGWMYMMNLNYEDAGVSTAEYNQVFGSSLHANDQCPSNGFGNPTPLTATMPCFGNGRGGLSQEGGLYGGWLLHFPQAALAIKTSGNWDPTNYPQLSLYTSSWWDEEFQGLLHMTTPALYTPSQTYQNLFAYGPMNASYDQLNFIANIPIATYSLDAAFGRTDRNNTTGWLMGNMDLSNSLATNMAGNLPGAIALVMTQLPGANPFSGFTDPRSTMPPGFNSYNAGNLFASTGSWSGTTGSVFRVYCPRFPQPNHEEGYCTDFDFYRNGDWTTKGIYSYAFNDNTGYWTGETPDTGNMSGYANTPTTQLPNPTGQYYIDTLANRGGQYSNGWPTGQAINDIYNDMPTYTAAHYDSTGERNLYGPGAGVGIVGAQDITAATRDFLWIKPLYLAVYDRGDTGTTAFKRQWFMSTGTVTQSGTNLSWPSALNKTSNYLHVLLQPSANIKTYPVYPFAEGIAFGDYAPNTRIEIDANTVTSTTEAYTTAACTGGSICPTHRANAINDTGVTGGVACGSLTQISTLGTLASCQYLVTSDFRYFVTALDLAAGVTIHYDYSTPATSMRSLNVFEAQNFGTGATGATLVQSTAGQNFDCALIGTSQACFMRNPGTFTGTTVAAAVTNYFSNLTPNTSYPITGTGTPANATSDTSGTLTFSAAGTGNISIGAGIVAPPTNLKGVVIQGAQLN